MTPINLANTNIYSGKHIPKMLFVRATHEGFILVCTMYINSKFSLHARHTSLTINHSKLFQQIMHKNDSAAHTFNQGTRLHIVRDAAPYLGVGGVTICK